MNPQCLIHPVTRVQFFLPRVLLPLAPAMIRSSSVRWGPVPWRLPLLATIATMNSHGPLNAGTHMAAQRVKGLAMGTFKVTDGNGCRTAIHGRTQRSLYA